ncbi:MAG TPA: hypothetical protein VHC68_00950 [Candidatus Paceibacterota bacterium]|nr:hypothetical protein [Candidatus Paceibacterota bacterium]
MYDENGPGTPPLGHLPHYYGDRVRELFVAGALISFIAIPIWGNILPFGVGTQIGAGLLLVILAGLTDPKNKGVMLLNALYAGISVLLLESAAIGMQAAESWQLFLVREVSALVLLIALYFAIKTARAMSLGEIPPESKS